MFVLKIFVGKNMMERKISRKFQTSVTMNVLLYLENVMCLWVFSRKIKDFYMLILVNS